MRILHLLTGAAVAATLVFSGNPARAAEDATEASATGKGITGGALLGAEVIMLVEAAIKVKKPWAYAVGGIAGGIAGGVGGYFIEDGAEPKISIYLLAGGMALAIPTTVAVLNATAYKPPRRRPTEDRAPAKTSPSRAGPPAQRTSPVKARSVPAGSPRRPVHQVEDAHLSAASRGPVARRSTIEWCWCARARGTETPSPALRSWNSASNSRPRSVCR